MNLTATSDFVLENNKNCVQGKSLLDTDWRKEFEIQYKKHVNHAKFVKQPLEKWMFVPCDEDGNVLEKPIMFYSEENIKRLKGVEIEIANSVNNRVKKYQQAKERVLFKGFQVCERPGNIPCVVKDQLHLFWKGKTVEDLVKYGLELTPTAEKQIEL